MIFEIWYFTSLINILGIYSLHADKKNSCYNKSLVFRALSVRWPSLVILRYIQINQVKFTIVYKIYGSVPGRKILELRQLALWLMNIPDRYLYEPPLLLLHVMLSSVHSPLFLIKSCKFTIPNSFNLSYYFYILR